MAQNKEHRSVWSLHGPLLEMTNGLSCPLNFLRCCFAFAPGPSRRESLSITRAQVPPDGRGRSTVGPPTYSKGVFSCDSVSWGHVAANLSGGLGPWKIYTEVMSEQKVLSRRPVLERKHDRVQCPRVSPRAPLLSLLLCQKCFTLLRGKGGGGEKNKQNNTRTQYKHIRVDSQTARQPMSARFRFYVTVTYIQCSVQRHFLNLWRRQRKGHGFVCVVSHLACFPPGKESHIQGTLTSPIIFSGIVCLESVGELCRSEKSSSSQRNRPDVQPTQR